LLNISSVEKYNATNSFSNVLDIDVCIQDVGGIMGSVFDYDIEPYCFTQTEHHSIQDFMSWDTGVYKIMCKIDNHEYDKNDNIFYTKPYI
jgi:hypothetical protein